MHEFLSNAHEIIPVSWFVWFILACFGLMAVWSWMSFGADQQVRDNMMKLFALGQVGGMMTAVVVGIGYVAYYG